MLHSLLTAIDRAKSFKTASAHCDIPCKIYDPSTAQIAVLTMIRLVDLIEELDAKADKTISDQAQLTRLVNEKEAHGLAVKEEVRVIWGDYIKQPQLEKFPQLHGLVHNIMLQASKAKQHVSRDETVKLLSLVNEFADIFWQTKDVETFTATCPYPPSEKVVYPKLSD
jgi:nickel superoxide dismutase